MRAFRPRREHSALHGITAETIARWCRVHVTTARRWKRGEEPPFAALMWIELRSTGDLGVIDPDWRGWRLIDGRLHDPNGAECAPGTIMGIPFLRQLIAHYQTEQSLPRQADWLEERWMPAREIVDDTGTG